jgi:hypothetical protein
MTIMVSFEAGWGIEFKTSQETELTKFRESLKADG